MQNWCLVWIRRTKKNVFIFWEVQIRSSCQIMSVSVFEFCLSTKSKCSMIQNQLSCKFCYLHLTFWTRVSLYGIRCKLAVGSVHKLIVGRSYWRATLQPWSNCARHASVCLWYCVWHKKLLPAMYLLGEERYVCPKDFNGDKLMLKAMEDLWVEKQTYKSNPWPIQCLKVAFDQDLIPLGNTVGHTVRTVQAKHTKQPLATWGTRKLCENNGPQPEVEWRTEYVDVVWHL